MREVGLNWIIGRGGNGRNSQFDVESALKVIVFIQLIDPVSELATYEWLKKKVYFPEGKSLKLQHLYRSLDFIAEEKKLIEKGLSDKLLNLFSMDLDVVFYNTTLVSFSGKGPDVVKYSRNEKKQFLVGLMLSRDGFPFAHEVMPRNTSDVTVTTVGRIGDKLSQRFSISRCLFVGDRGMVSWDNLDHLKSKGYGYIMGVPAKRYKEVRELVLSTPGRCHSIKENLQLKETQLGGNCYIICHNPKEAERNQKKRQSIIQKLKEKIANIDPTTNQPTKEAKKLLAHRKNPNIFAS